ncbi:hypothetical protein FHT17_002221 [Novosphingobium sp. SG916]|nr:hypothetical protein [Novosphingobium sp. SG919]NMN87322.1 hypothetical protein [Novosphingobium sp. SG916]
MDTAVSPLPNDIEALKALVLAATHKADLATQCAAMLRRVSPMRKPGPAPPKR